MKESVLSLEEITTEHQCSYFYDSPLNISFVKFDIWLLG